MEKTDENLVHRGTGTEKVSLTLKRSLRVPKRFHAFRPKCARDKTLLFDSNLLA